MGGYIYIYIYIMRGKKDVTTFPDKPVSWIASLFRGLMKEYSYDYRLYTRKICIIRGKLKNFKVQLLRSNVLFLCRHVIYIYTINRLTVIKSKIRKTLCLPHTAERCELSAHELSSVLQVAYHGMQFPATHWNSGHVFSGIIYYYSCKFLVR